MGKKGENWANGEHIENNNNLFGRNEASNKF